MVSQTTPLVALVTKFGGGLSVEILLANCIADNAFGDPGHQVWWRDPYWDAAWPTVLQRTPLVAVVTMFGNELPVGMLLAARRFYKAFGGSRHQV